MGLCGPRQHIATNAPVRAVKRNETILPYPFQSGPANLHTALAALKAEGRNNRAKENSVKRGLTVAVAGAAIVVAGISGCSSNKSGTASSTGVSVSGTS